MGATQGCVLSPLLFTLLTHDCTPSHSSNLIKFADDTTMVGLISNDDETDYRSEWRGRAAPSFWMYTSQDLSWTINTTSLANKANQRLYFLRKAEES
ncbi:hypothetical protein L3Q82_005019 [Scortum barcoo]|uniref:Uncharacterized protein n=1 Tax=Scortum barcoo TaxID=214431 RepID=A0ACB8VDQ8_9TELE|nr:hypothetical protein L3Q82_005019 [Scortum barcoo]